MRGVRITFQTVMESGEEPALEKTAFLPLSKMMEHNGKVQTKLPHSLLALYASVEARKFWEAVVLMGLIDSESTDSLE
jgi:hypothetical protein